MADTHLKQGGIVHTLYAMMKSGVPNASASSSDQCYMSKAQRKQSASAKQVMSDSLDVLLYMMSYQGGSD